MSHDGTVHSDYAPPTPTARQIIEAYHRSVVRTATTYDVWQAGDALLGRIEEVADELTVVEERVEVIEEEIEPLPTIEENVREIQDVVAAMIFELNEIGINFQLDQINEFRIKYLNIK